MKVHPLLRMIEVGEWVSANFQPATYSSMLIDPIGIASIGAGYTPVENYDSEVTPRGITTDLVAGTIAFNIPGVFQIAVMLNLSHNESNQGRTTNLRFWNVTEGTSGGILEIGIARNQPATNFTAVFQAEIASPDVNDAYRIELGGGDAITIADGSVDYDATMVSEWRGFASEGYEF